MSSSARVAYIPFDTSGAGGTRDASKTPVRSQGGGVPGIATVVIPLDQSISRNIRSVRILELEVPNVAYNIAEGNSKFHCGAWSMGSFDTDDETDTLPPNHRISPGVYTRAELVAALNLAAPIPTDVRQYSNNGAAGARMQRPIMEYTTRVNPDDATDAQQRILRLTWPESGGTGDLSAVLEGTAAFPQRNTPAGDTLGFSEGAVVAAALNYNFGRTITEGDESYNMLHALLGHRLPRDWQLMVWDTDLVNNPPVWTGTNRPPVQASLDNNYGVASTVAQRIVMELPVSAALTDVIIIRDGNNRIPILSTVQMHHADIALPADTYAQSEDISAALTSASEGFGATGGALQRGGTINGDPAFSLRNGNATLGLTQFIRLVRQPTDRRGAGTAFVDQLTYAADWTGDEATGVFTRAGGYPFTINSDEPLRVEYDL